MRTRFIVIAVFLFSILSIKLNAQDSAKIMSNTTVPDDETKFMTPEEKENFYRQIRVKKTGKIAFAFFLGVIPDLGGMSDSGASLRKINDEMNRMVSLYNFKSSNAAAGFYSSAELTQSAKSLIGFPVSFYFYFLENFYLIRTGFNYTFSSVAINEFTAVQDPGSATVGNTTGLNTFGKTMRITSRVKMSYFEIPLTIALRIVNVWGSGIYFGGGPSLFVGGWKRETIKNEVNTVNLKGSIPDVDSYFAIVPGFHFVIGGEVYLAPDLSLTAEFVMSRGSTGRALDRVTSKSVETLKTDNDQSVGEQDSGKLDIGAGGIETGTESNEIQFGGIGINIGIKYIL